MEQIILSYCSENKFPLQKYRNMIEDQETLPDFPVWPNALPCQAKKPISMEEIQAEIKEIELKIKDFESIANEGSTDKEKQQ